MKEHKKIFYPIASLALTVPFIACSGEQESNICTSFPLEPTNTGQLHDRPSQSAFDNFAPSDKDSLNSKDFKEFFRNSNCLIKAWTVANSIYRSLVQN